MLFVEAFLLGLMGSLHCIGMCGPIALALPLKDDSTFSRIFSGLLYNLGRVFTYSLMGLGLGLLGQSLEWWGWQRWTSIVVGAVMVLWVLIPLVFPKLPRFHFQFPWADALKKPLSALFGKRSYLSVWLIGILNGLLPCGLVYIALAGALVSGYPAEGAFYMAAFGLGTLPVLLILNLARTLFPVGVRQRIGRIIPWMVFFFGLLFILRGMNLGIPYISPAMEKPGCAKCCHS